jgi:hypothetical protein
MELNILSVLVKDENYIFGYILFFRTFINLINFIQSITYNSSQFTFLSPWIFIQS